MKKNTKINICIGIVIVCFVISIFILNMFNKKVFPIFMNYAVSEIKMKTTTLINNVVSDELSNISNLDELIFITKNSNEDIQMIDFNSSHVNKILNSITKSLIEKLNIIENNGELSIFDNYEIDKYNKGIIYEIPMGVIFNNMFLSNLGPKIPLKLKVVGDVFTNIDTEIRQYGINNALVEIFVDVSITQRVIVPFMSKDVKVFLSIPVSLKLIQGNIPIYYGNAFERKSNILSTPTE